MKPDRNPAGRVLIVEDCADIREILSRVLLGAGFEVAVAETGKRALELASAGQFNVLVVDLGLPDMDGTDLVKRVREAGSRSRILVLSGRVDALSPTALDGLAVDKILPKPVSCQTFLDEVRRWAAAGMEPAKRSAQEEVWP